jgi:hypothetical protein
MNNEPYLVALHTLDGADKEEEEQDTAHLKFTTSNAFQLRLAVGIS